MTHRIHRIDNDIVTLQKHSLDKWAVFLNGREISAGFGGVERGKIYFNETVEALKNKGYEYEEFVQDRVETDAMPDSESAERFVLSRVYSDGSVDDLNYSDDESELVELLKQD